MKNIIKITRYFSTSQELKKTLLHNYQKTQLGGKMVPFAGYEMPVQFKEGVLKEHLHCRASSSVFDVSHMGQVKIYGKDRVDYMEKLTVGNIRDCKDNTGYLSLILNHKAGIIDDTIITNMGDHINMVVNGANKEIDLKHMKEVQEEFFKDKDIKIEYQEQRSLIALQGPKSAEAIEKLVGPDVHKMTFMNHYAFPLKELDTEIQLCRCGYTGEDGFEVSVLNEHIETVYDMLLQNPDIKPAGLGARDSLRLEAGLCLHGNDMDQGKTPAECSLMWTIRKGGKNTNVVYPFIGRKELTAQRKAGLPKRRIGFILTQKGIIRPPAEVYSTEGELIGSVSSGCFSPNLGQGIGMCFLKPEYTTEFGTDIVIKMKNRQFKAKTHKTPFIETNYAK